MNIVTQFPVNLNLNFANPQTEEARKETLSRNAITEPSENEQSASQFGAGSDRERAQARANQQALTYDFSRSELNKTDSNKTEKQAQEALNQSGENADNFQDATEEHENRGHAFQQQNQENSDSNTSTNSNSEEQQLTELKSRDKEVRAHEQAHATIGGQYAASPTYEYEKGTDGKNYAVAGEVQIDVSPIQGDPEATIRKMEQVRRAALAPAEPSNADRNVASDASIKAQEARVELNQVKANEEKETIDNALLKDNNLVNNSVAAVFSQTSSINKVDTNDLTKSEYHTIQNESPKLEPKQTLAYSDEYTKNINERDQTINSRALKIQRFYHQTSTPNQINFTHYA